MNTKQSLIKLLAALVMLFCFKLALAVVPPALNYQGHLTDSAGAPIDGPVTMIFTIYDVDTGGTALWDDRRSVTVEQGVFSVELGPFPLGLFENPLWMGLTVETDAEMSPRRPISSTAFSFKADDANTLEGVSASTLDQSSHVIDNANPHNVTATQVGAADAATLSAHTSNISNPHSVTAAQTGAATSANFTAHTGDINAHHSRYTNTEAVNAMGANNDSNALNHDRYSDTNAVAAIKAADGAGSTLDADLVDGLQASELIDAAQDEVRTPISALPYTINVSGSYYLTGNLAGSAGGIDITVDDVTLDLMGFTIDGGGNVSDYGINFTQRSNITIKNGTVKDFGLAGIYQDSTLGHYATVVDLQVLANGTLGTSNAHSGIYLRSSNSHIERCTAGDNGGHGIYAYTSSKLIDNTAHNNGGSYAILGLNGSNLTGNTAYNNTGTHTIYGGAGSSLSGNTAYSNTSTYAIWGANGTSLSGNTAYSNTGSGIYGNDGANLTDNTAYLNAGNAAIHGGEGSKLSGNTAYQNTSTYAIWSGSGASLSGNTARNNTSNIAIYVDAGSTVIGNTAYSNSNWGMRCIGASLIKDNVVSYNNNTDTVGEGGLYVGINSRVIGNTLDGNSQNNIYINASDSILRENHVIGSINGIFFNASGNYYRENTGSGNTTTFNLNGTTQTDGGGNVSF